MPPSPHRLSRRQALQLVETAYMAAATALLWAGLYYLPVGGALFRLALPLPIALLLLRQGWRCGWEGMVVASLLLVALMGPIRGPLVLFPYGALALWLGWGWRSNWSWWLTWGVGLVIGAGGFLVRVTVLSVLVGENLWVLITAAAAGLLERISALLNLGGGPDLLQVQALALGLVVVQNLIYVLALHAVAYWIFPRLQAPIPEPPEALRALVALDPL
ncbi:MAG: DUF2232 domain-containing protein [Cyanobium sp.]|jgi:uncharacterized protein YybS (DUF2232 family)|uniref:DUF2232 domain-containing protein n=1 Tax=unclassified Synechococcus TaxID=2626047 RepID=UPI000DBBF8BA|nr:MULTISPECIES: DUF2232 domain-containing protein [unclassified Synechococcus]MCP9827552.1 DUF2232 domain-containing protein [Synechococcus sp. L2F]MCP9846520.1 DUF2232 domain-containing protein [Synechococcus sp. Lug-A]MCT0209265.1 DUF2232 domain-containing protein [Synechococcus sp. CS-1333]PZV21521.1 MAG: DUF2232 domain-containing protein [Cyanobium sp.]